MTKYIRRQTPIEAFQYAGQKSIEDLPQWLQDFKNPHDINGSGVPFISVSTDLMIPNRFGSIKCVNNDWVILESGDLTRFTDAQFHAAFIETSDTLDSAPAEPSAEA